MCTISNAFFSSLDIYLLFINKYLFFPFIVLLIFVNNITIYDPGGTFYFFLDRITA